MRAAIILAGIVGTGLAGSALADEGLDYTYVEGGYVHTKLDDLDITGNGVGILGSYAFTGNAFGFASYATQDFDFNIDVDQWEFGAGLNYPLSPKLDVVGTLSYVGVKLDAPGFGSADDSGVGIGARLRGRVNDTLELLGGVSYVDLNDSGNGTSGNLGLRAYVLRWARMSHSPAMRRRTCWARGSTSIPGKPADSPPGEWVEELHC